MQDVQNHKDTRCTPIDEVGVSHVTFPFSFPLKDGIPGTFYKTVATIAMGVSLPHDRKGTHMSRFVEELNKHDTFHPGLFKEFLTMLCSRLDASTSFISVSFPFFLKKAAPVSKKEGLLDYQCGFRACFEATGKHYNELVEVKVPVTSLCPCSKEISVVGAHNQRSEISIQVIPSESYHQTIWLEDLIDVAESSSSCPVYSVLKREDEKYVTEWAFNHPCFVEDSTRSVSLQLSEMQASGALDWFRVICTNFESIHNHNAYARIEKGKNQPQLHLMF